MTVNGALKNTYKRRGNSEAQVKFWMGFRIELDGDDDSGLRSVVATDAALSLLAGNLTIG